MLINRKYWYYLWQGYRFDNEQTQMC